MPRALFAIRLIMILTAVIATVFISPIDSYAVYTFCSLLLVAVETTFGQRPREYPLRLWVTLPHIGYIAFLCIRYDGLMFLAFYAVLFTLQPERNRPGDWLLLAAQWAAMDVVLANAPIVTVIMANLMQAVILVAIYLLGNVSRQREEIEALYDSLRENHYELEGARNRIVDYARRVEDAAQLAERNRIAKDIHDELGHQLIRVKLMLETAIGIVPKDGREGMDMLYRIRDQLAQTMDTLRATVRKLKPGDESVSGLSLQQLADNFNRDGSVRAELIVTGRPIPLYPSIQVALYRNAQESMTNAVRHGGATVIQICLHYGETHVELTVTNNGRVPDGAVAKGLGLRGMEERTELLGGSLRSEVDGRFAIACSLPYEHRPVAPVSKHHDNTGG